MELAGFVDAARAERKRLYRELSSNPAFQRYITLRKLIRLYAADVDEDEEAGLGSEATATKPQSAKPTRSGSFSAKVEAAAYEWLKIRGRRAQSPELIEAMRAQGLQFSGSKPTAVLASILSHSEKFDNVRGEGYGLSEWSGATTALPLDSDQDHTPQTSTPTPTTSESAS